MTIITLFNATIIYIYIYIYISIHYFNNEFKMLILLIFKRNFKT